MSSRLRPFAIWCGLLLLAATIVALSVALPSARWRAVALLVGGPIGLCLDAARHGPFSAEKVAFLSVLATFIVGPTAYAVLVRIPGLAYYGAIHWVLVTWGIWEMVSL